MSRGTILSSLGRQARVFLAGAALALSLSSPAALAQDEELYLTITTGSENGTYTRFAREIAAMLPSVRFEIVPSGGSVQNLKRLIGYEGHDTQQYFQLALVQADVLDQLRVRAEGNEVLKSVVDRIKVVMPLYGEEIHVYAHQSWDMNSVGDILNGQVQVNAGGETSGTNLTSRWLFEQLGHSDQTANWENFSVELGLPNIGLGYDVVFDVSGAPSSLGKSITPDQELELLPIKEYASLLDSAESPYRKALLTRDQYPWLEEDVETLAVTALLVTFDYDEDNPYCDLIAQVTRAIRDGLEDRKNPISGSHPKWREVNLVEAGNRKDIYKCAARVLNGR
ncbi:TAXI family TRAP transporter solute-binding subunit [Dinoroseobacter sp. S124A]|uniref:TAXI family TRAP transporter solute-binding subunit n=1 Tax=Dinoroseobacter sp. S124A TaxID=3415128 RepID=UPI003C7C57F8